MESDMKEKLIQLGCRVEGNFTLHSGGFSTVKWDIEKLFSYPEWMIERAIGDWIWAIGKLCPDILQGIPKGGSKLAGFLKPLLVCIASDEPQVLDSWETVIVDDVLTTGGSVREAIGAWNLAKANAEAEAIKKNFNTKPKRFFYNSKITAIAILVNRSSFTEIEGIPIISGFFTDEVK